jgi:hypothetical protein
VVVVVLVVCLQSLGAKASVHDYRGQIFFDSGNTFILYGGSEGLFASPVFLSTRLTQMAVLLSVRLLKICVSSLLVL